MPLQPEKVGVTVIVATIGVLPVLVATNDGIVVPEPEDNRPIKILLFVQL